MWLCFPTRTNIKSGTPVTRYPASDRSTAGHFRLQNLFVFVLVLFNCRTKVRSGRHSARCVPSLFVVVSPRRLPTATILRINACHFVIALAFYPALLIVSHKFGVHHQPFGLSDTLGGFIARLTLTLYALRWRVLFPLTSELAVKQVVNSSECVSPIPCINSSVIKLKYLTPLSKRFCCVSYRDFDI